MRWFLVALPFVLVALPFALRPAPAPEPAERIVVITPHGEQIRSEFTRAFAAWARRELHREIGIDWRTPGGTGDIIRYLATRYRERLQQEHGELDSAQLRRFDDPDAGPDHPARRAFLALQDGVGVDVFFGGGEFPHRQMAKKGYLVDAGLLTAEPTWFGAGGIPPTLTGERMYDPQGRYYGACLSAFGIAVNAERAASLPAGWEWNWRSLADPRLAGGVVIADPSKSGANVTACERILQTEMAAACADPDHPTPAELERGWSAGWRVVRLAVANSAFISDGASRAVRSAARGDAVASLCIDFHARAEGSWTLADSGLQRMELVVPRSGTSWSADPISLLRGAPHRELAVAFMRFVLSPEGQRLWNARRGVPGGPVRYELRRMPIRPDAYADRAAMTDPGVDPYADAKAFTYRPALTGALYNLIAPLAKAALIDPRDELQEAWAAIRAAGGPEAVPAAMAELDRLPTTWAAAAATLARLDESPVARLAIVRDWCVAAQAQYREAARLAREGR